MKARLWGMMGLIAVLSLATIAQAEEIRGKGMDEHGNTCTIWVNIDKWSHDFVVAPGGEITYIILLQNLGTCNLRDLVLKDLLSEEVRYVSSSRQPVRHDGTVIWKGIDLRAGEFTLITLKVRADQHLRKVFLCNKSCVYLPKYNYSACDAFYTRVVELGLENSILD